MAGLLDTIFSAYDSKKRQLSRKVEGLLSDPVETIYQGIKNFGEDQRGLLDTQAQAYPFIPRSQDQSARIAGFKRTPDQAKRELADAGTAQAMAAMFVGKGSKTWDALSAQKAEQMTAQGIDPRKVWSETGTWKGPDGAWRQEIPDNMAKGRDYQLTPATAFQNARFEAAINDSQPMRDRAESMLPYFQKTKNQLTDEYSTTGGKIVDAALGGDKELAKRLQSERGGLSAILEEMANTTHGPASSFLKHGDLGKAYPDVYKLHTRIDKADDVLDGARGHYFQGDRHQGEQIVLKEKPWASDGKSTALHEMQHAIQQREGWARGGSPEAIRRNPMDFARPEDIEYAKTLPAYESAADKNGFINSFVQMRLGHPVEAYRNLAGEAEARATQARIPLDAAQRRALFPEDSYDVPMNQLIIRGLLGN